MVRSSCAWLGVRFSLPTRTDLPPFDGRRRRLTSSHAAGPFIGRLWLTQGLTFTKLFAKLFSKKEMRILMVRPP